MKSLNQIVGIAAAAALLSGMSLVQVRAQEPAAASASVPAAGASAPAASASSPVAATATLYVINDSGPTLMSSNQDLTDNGEALASLPRQTWTKREIAAGRHEFRFKAFQQGKRVAYLDAQPGGTYYLVSAYSPGKSWGFPFGGDPLSIRIIDAGQAQALMQGMREQAP